MRISPVNLAKRTERWKHRLAPLGVSHFEIDSVTITDDVPGADRAQAAVQVSRHYDSCRFFFNEEFIEECTSDELDQTIIHEWLHVAWRDLEEATSRVEDWMPPRYYDDFDERITHEMEGLIERLARTIWAARRTN